MIHEASALTLLKNNFRERAFSAREATRALPFSHGTTLVALSTMAKDGLLERVKKGVYMVKESGEEDPALSLRSLKRPNIKLLPRAYATATYALSNELSPLAASRYLDIFVTAPDYQKAITAIEVKDTFPEPRVHPYATYFHRALTETMDGLPVPPSRVAFVDLMKIVSEKRRQASLEYEIVPFIPQLVGQWSKIRKLAEREGVRDYLEAIVCYVSLIAKSVRQSDIELPEFSTDYEKATPPRSLVFEGGKVDEISVETADKTGIVLEANQEAVKSVLANL